ncbi:MAG: 16S rRNA (cytosine(1402)-N(4))-methyltransferase RsmH, partial [Clostridia bacterium]|nr:16S rRNA (cytosine(1402)-N(4))-methyltransferase RsmH [Clostridia bacterium]
FSYHKDAPLDMRMDQNAPLTAEELVNTASEVELGRILWEYGEEKNARRIAAAIVKAREADRIRTTGALAEIIKSAFRERDRFGDKHPARRSFQAIRIAVNRELDVIPKAIDALVPRLLPGGRLAVITFHSLEDRLVKENIRKYADGCTCPPDFPVCVCGFVKKLKPLTQKPILPGAEEIEANPRSRSAKLRAAEKV